MRGTHEVACFGKGLLQWCRAGQDSTATNNGGSQVSRTQLLDKKGLCNHFGIWRKGPHLPAENSTTLSRVRFACQGDQQAQAILKVMAGLSQEDIAAVAGAWAAIGGRARRQIEWESLESSGFCILNKGLVCLCLPAFMTWFQVQFESEKLCRSCWKATRFRQPRPPRNLWRSKTPSRLHCLCKRSNMQWKAVVCQGLASSDTMGPG